MEATDINLTEIKEQLKQVKDIASIYDMPDFGYIYREYMTNVCKKKLMWN